MPAPRVRKLNETVRAALAEILVSELQDPRLELATVTSVEVSPDMRYADVFVTAHGGERRYEELLAGLESAKGRLRAALGQRVTMKYLPELRFHIDESVDIGQRIERAIKRERTCHPEWAEDEDAGDDG
ncbi:ribosome-binding factor A [Coriobacteriaceae bacterium EMTCatB1]|nr:ribosome-binding factor A [Coriobacteriaceae bacterium EMTCatB1]